MTDFTKKVTVTYGSVADQIGANSDPFTLARWTKMTELKTAEKTDGVVVYPKVAISENPISVIKFVDQSSAEEYLTAILQAAATAGVDIVASAITDV